MARPIRIEYPGAMYQVMCRGNNGREVFFGEDGCKKFLDTLDEACARAGWFVHAYVMMGNHYHLLLETPESNLVDGMKWFQGTYTQRINACSKGDTRRNSSTASSAMTTISRPFQSIST